MREAAPDIGVSDSAIPELSAVGKLLAGIHSLELRDIFSEPAAHACVDLRGELCSALVSTQRLTSRRCPKKGEFHCATIPGVTSKGGCMSRYTPLVLFFICAGLLTCMIGVGLASLLQ